MNETINELKEKKTRLEKELAEVEEKINNLVQEETSSFRYRGWSACKKMDRGNLCWQVYTCKAGKRKTINLGRSFNPQDAKKSIDRYEIRSKQYINICFVKNDKGFYGIKADAKDESGFVIFDFDGEYENGKGFGECKKIEMEEIPQQILEDDLWQIKILVENYGKNKK